MRRAVLWNSMLRIVAAVDGEAGELRQAAYVWSRHRLMLPFAAAAFAALVIVGYLVGFETWAARIGLGVAGAAVAVNATTEYRVLGLTEKRIVVARASRVRQKATNLVKILPLDVRWERAGGGTIVSSNWHVGEATYTAPKVSEIPMEDISHRLRNP